MNENHNVKNEENSQEIYSAVSNLVRELVNLTVPSNSQNPITTAPKSTVPKQLSEERSVHIHGSKPERIPHAQNSQSSQGEHKPTYEIFRASGGQFSESQSDFDVGVCASRLNEAKTRNAPPMPSVPPSYSTVIKQGRPSLDIRRDVRSMEAQHLSPFTRIPPPSYAEIQGVWSREISNASSEQVLLGPEPIYIWCTHCATVVITVTQSQRSKFTHLTAAALCLFGCWPCAMLPYCMNSCKNIYHYCPDCNYLFGMYRPW